MLVQFQHGFTITMTKVLMKQLKIGLVGKMTGYCIHCGVSCNLWQLAVWPLGGLVVGIKQSFHNSFSENTYIFKA